MDFSFDPMEFNATEEPGRVIAGYRGATMRRKAMLFRRALDVGNTNLICKYDGKLYLQKRGLAMGGVPVRS